MSILSCREVMRPLLTTCLVAVSGMTASCSPSRDQLVGVYIAERLGGNDTLWLGPDGFYLQHAVLKEGEAWQRDRWTMEPDTVWPYAGDVALENPIIVDDAPRARDLVLATFRGVQGFGLDRFRIDRSLGAGEDRPRYRRLRGEFVWPMNTPSDSINAGAASLPRRPAP